MSEIGRAYDQDTVTEAAQLQLTNEEPRHDRFADTRIVREQEADSRHLEEMVVNRFKLMWKRVHARYGQAKIWIEFVGNSEGVGLNGEADHRRKNGQTPRSGEPSTPPGRL